MYLWPPGPGPGLAWPSPGPGLGPGLGLGPGPGPGHDTVMAEEAEQGDVMERVVEVVWAGSNTPEAFVVPLEEQLSSYVTRRCAPPAPAAC